MTAIAAQIRTRLDAIAAERASVDDEERRLKKALEVLESTPVETSETPGLSVLDYLRLLGTNESFVLRWRLEPLA